MPEFRPHDFPANFTWGTATAAYQIEGAAQLHGREPSIWDTFSHTPGNVKNGDTGDVACDHYHRFADDLELIRDLGFGAYRFSLSWPRVLPLGQPSEAGLSFYDRLVDGLLERGITPWATLYHWDLPQSLQDTGGWGNRDTALRLAEYTEVVTKRLGDRVKDWITINEPWCVAFLGHGAGIHAPGFRDQALSLRASHHVLLAHGLAVDVVRANVPEARVGITLNLTPAYPASDSDADRLAATRFDGFFNRWYLDPVHGRGYPADMLEAYGQPDLGIQDGDLKIIATPTDFLGINYYSRAVSKHADNGLGFAAAPMSKDTERTFMDWEVYPNGLTDLLTRLKRDYGDQPLYVTENGASYEDHLTSSGAVHDLERTRYYERHLKACLEAIRAGVDLRGYFAWSLLDNFEWAEGYEKRFGLVRVDFDSQHRTVKDSGRWFQDFLGVKTPVPS
jgi:beta-glucosidase